MTGPVESSEDTIAAISTPLGEGGVGIIRISGPAALIILKRLSPNVPPHPETHKIYLATILSPQTKAPIDKAHVAFMERPKTYTGEDIVEISCHGGVAVLDSVLKSAILCGARVARNGEFTKRAFLNGKIDLAQAEAVINLIKARTEEGAALAANQVLGALSTRIKDIRKDVLGILARIEASIDFPDDVLSPGEGLGGEIDREICEIDALLKTADTENIATRQCYRQYPMTTIWTIYNG